MAGSDLGSCAVVEMSIRGALWCAISDEISISTGEIESLISGVTGGPCAVRCWG